MSISGSTSIIDLTDFGAEETERSSSLALEIGKLRKRNRYLAAEKRILTRKLHDLKEQLQAQQDAHSPECKEPNMVSEGHGQVQEFKQLLRQIQMANASSVSCSVMQFPSKKLYILHPCGHTFSEYALHNVLQDAVLVEFKLMKHIYPKKFTDNAGSDSPMFSSERLRRFRELSAQFTPKYRCPLCKSTITQCPVRCWNLFELGNTVTNLISPFVGVTELLEDDVDTGDAYPDLSTYFVYFEPNFIDIIRSFYL